MFTLLRRLFPGKKPPTSKGGGTVSALLPHELLLLHCSEAVESGALSSNEQSSIAAAETLLRHGTIAHFSWSGRATRFLTASIDRGVTLHQLLQEEADEFARAKAARASSGYKNLSFSESLSRSSLAFSDHFVRSISNLDKKVQGRVLEAMTKIAEAPTLAHGDTIKPLTGNLKGLWRYRIGDYRLVYDPNLGDSRVLLLSVEPRGEAYREAP